MAEPVESDFAAQYKLMSEPELLTLAADYESLIDSARAAMRAEFAARRLEPPFLESDETVSRNLVIVARYRDLSEAIVARTVVQSAGIFCFLRDENLVRLDWQLSNFIGGIALQVAAEDRAEAEELLSQPIPATIPFEGEIPFEQPHCPRCGSIDVTFEGSGRKAALSSLYLVGLPLPLGEKSWLCETCGCRWVEESGKASPDPDSPV